MNYVYKWEWMLDGWMTIVWMNYRCKFELMLDGWNDKSEYGWIIYIHENECWMDEMAKVSMDE